METVPYYYDEVFLEALLKHLQLISPG